MNLLEAEVKYADALELPLYNSAISGMALDGKSFFYQNTLESPRGAERREWIGLACCPTNLARFTPQVGGYVYAQRDDRLYLNLFAAGEAKVTVGGKAVRLVQQTDYPWKGKVTLKVDPSGETDMDLRLRIPQWLKDGPVPGDLYRYASTGGPTATLRLNGEPVELTPGGDGYVSLKRRWKAGDLLDVDLPMPVRRVHSHKNVEGNRGKVALMRGPVVYCFEGIDHPGVDLFKLRLPKNARFKTEHRPDMLNGVTVITTTGVDEEGGKVELTAIPYFAWANRGKSPMAVWIDEAREQGSE
jgi:DUF1680 family protein